MPENCFEQMVFMDRIELGCILLLLCRTVQRSLQYSVQVLKSFLTYGMNMIVMQPEVSSEERRKKMVVVVFLVLVRIGDSN